MKRAPVLGQSWIAAAIAGVTLAACATVGHDGKGSSDPGYVARVKLAHQLVDRADWARAFAMLDELHRQQPEDVDVLTMRGIVYRERGLYPDAETDLRAALAVSPDDAEAHAALGILYDVQMRPDAEQEHRTAARLAPNNPAYLNNLGFSLFLRQHFKDAIKEYEKAAHLAPLSPRVRTNLGFAYAALGDLPRAAREFRMGGSEAEANNNLGFAYERRGDMSNAYDMYLAAVKLDPIASRPRSNLAHVAAALGRPIPPEAQAPPPRAPAAPVAAALPPPSPSASATAPADAPATPAREDNP